MKMGTKIALIIAAGLTLLGGLLFTCVMTALGWNFSALATTEYQTTRHEVKETFRHISVDSCTVDVHLVITDQPTVTVECREKVKMAHSVTVEGDTLVIRAEDTRTWGDYIGIDTKSARVTVSLPRGDYGNLTVETTTGDMDIAAGLAFETVTLDTTTGDQICRATVTGLLKMKTVTGDICLAGVTAGETDLSVTTGDIAITDLACAGDVTIRAGTADLALSRVTCRNLTANGGTGDTKLIDVVASEGMSLSRTTGDIRFTRCDAAELAVKTTTGDVKGSLRTPKIFLASATTGDIRVPASTEGGTCKITTNTGDIEITVEP